MRLTLASLRVWRRAPHLAPTDSKALPLGPVTPTLWKNVWPVRPQNFGLCIFFNLLRAFVHKISSISNLKDKKNKVLRSTTNTQIERKLDKVFYLKRYLAKINRPQICHWAYIFLFHLIRVMWPNIRQIGYTRSERKKEMRVTYLPARSAVTWIWKGGGGYWRSAEVRV